MGDLRMLIRVKKKKMLFWLNIQFSSRCDGAAGVQLKISGS